LLPSRGGVFEVVCDGDLIYSKKKTGRHAEYEEVLATVRSRT
jgi:selenoprotein W-related protein